MAVYPRFLMGPVTIEAVHAEGDEYVSWSFTERIYGLQFADDLAIAPDGTRFDPRTLELDSDGVGRAVKVPPAPTPRQAAADAAEIDRLTEGRERHNKRRNDAT